MAALHAKAADWIAELFESMAFQSEDVSTRVPRDCPRIAESCFRALVVHRTSQVPGESIRVPLPCSLTPVGLASLTFTAHTVQSPVFEK